MGLSASQDDKGKKWVCSTGASGSNCSCANAARYDDVPGSGDTALYILTVCVVLMLHGQLQLYPPPPPQEVEVILRPIVSRPVCLDGKHASETRDKFFFLLEIFFRQLWDCYFVAPSLTRGRVWNLLYNCIWALPVQSLLGRSHAELTAIFYFLIWDSPNLEGQVPVFISPRNRVTKIYPRALGSLFVASFDSQGYGGGILTRLHTGQSPSQGKGHNVYESGRAPVLVSWWET
jgi:hypothetical protein